MRRQDEYLNSWHAQAVLSGEYDRDINELCLSIEAAGYFNYLEFVDRWSYVFGEENIVVRPFEVCQLKGGSSVIDFINIVNPCINNIDCSLENKSISRESRLLLKLISVTLSQYAATWFVANPPSSFH